ncbi:MAG: hypothetical protein KGQ48_04200 [Bradyrhizobium sp.]|uniref:hypothetical protein n=1 Tax=Bradyrhizobium sp. TaxID=376 RepID=UPI001ED36D13|nr:hypothetical protein [Bradyrhizobium sp.]MBU6456726.1 hypothetical protein [Bradyrhizobium sp.]MDE2601071.1 hypothetical protein [Bradyrhizobium sp.]
MVAITPHLEVWRSRWTPAIFVDAADRVVLAGDCTEFGASKRALWTLALNFAAPVIRKWSKRAAAAD